MTKVLITGVAGLLGANFSKYLLNKGYEIIGIDDLSGGFRSSVDDKVKFYEFNLKDSAKIKKVFEKHRPEYVYHFAAYAAEGLSPFIRNYNYTNNILCSVNIINACVEYSIKKLIFTSSMAVYGEGHPPYEEDQSLSPDDPSGIAKYAIELDLKLAYKQFGLDYSVVRPHNVVGIYQNIWDRYRNVIGIWIRQILNNESMSIFGDGTQIRAFSDISFYMRPFEKLMFEHSLETFNIGADKEYTINEASSILQEVANEFGHEASRVYLEKRNEVHTAYCNHTKAKNMLNFEDKTDLKETMRIMFKWALEQPSREVKFLEYEIEKGIYNFWKKK